ncbi:MAG: hypothetical protein J6D47_09320 [Peptostreptococcaceae bacterium]|nr:hypothetical protein [Peptostreptococcaceae bacterium]
MKLENYKMVSMVPVTKGSKAVVCTYVHKESGEEINIGRMMKQIVIKTERVNITIESTEIETVDAEPVKVDVVETEEEVKVSVRDRSFEFNYVVSRYRERAEKIRQEEENKPELIKKFNKFKNEFNKAGVKAIDSLIERLSN